MDTPELPQGLLPRVACPSSAAGTAALGAINTGTFVTATAQPQLPLSRQLTAGSGILVTDGGPQSAMTVTNLLTGANPSTTVGAAGTFLSKTTALNFASLVAGAGVTITAGAPTANDITIAASSGSVTAAGPVVLTMHWDFSDGVTPVGNAFTNDWVLYKVGRQVTAVSTPTGYTNPSILPGEVQTRAGYELPAEYRPIYDIVLPANISQGADVASISTFRIYNSGRVRPIVMGVQPYGLTPYKWPGGSTIDWENQSFTWLSAS